MSIITTIITLGSGLVALQQQFYDLKCDEMEISLDGERLLRKKNYRIDPVLLRLVLEIIRK